jgi:hypothetical protein
LILINKSKPLVIIIILLNIVESKFFERATKEKTRRFASTGLSLQEAQQPSVHNIVAHEIAGRTKGEAQQSHTDNAEHYVKYLTSGSDTLARGSLNLIAIVDHGRRDQSSGDERSVEDQHTHGHQHPINILKHTYILLFFSTLAE